MSITDELREWVKTLYLPCSDDLKREAERIADRIDAEHEASIIASGVKIVNDYVKLPTDADGEPIHIGDVMEVKFEPKRKPFTVSFVGERAVAFWVDGQPDLKSLSLDHVLVTHHEPTVESVLRDVVTLCHNTWKEGSASEFYDVDDVMNSGNIAEYADRIREVLRDE